MDPWWNPAVERQAQDRIHRIGQYKPIRFVFFAYDHIFSFPIISKPRKSMFSRRANIFFFLFVQF